MSNILKSTKLDIALVKPYFKTICFTLLLPIVFAAINRSLLTGVSFAMCFIAMTTGYTFSITEKNSMDRLFGILPVRKSELVIGRYVFVLAMGLLSLIISLIAQPPVVVNVLGRFVVFQHGKHGFDFPLQGPDHKGLCDVVHRAHLITPYLVALLIVGGQENYDGVRVLGLY
jgi:hypothetical protein